MKFLKLGWERSRGRGIVPVETAAREPAVNIHHRTHSNSAEAALP